MLKVVNTKSIQKVINTLYKDIYCIIKNIFISKFGTHTLDNKSTPEVSLSYMYDHFLRRDYSNVLPMPLDMKGNRIKGLPMKPKDTNDAVSAAFVIQESINMEQKALLRNVTYTMLSNGRLLRLGLPASHDNFESVQLTNPGLPYCMFAGPEMKVNVSQAARAYGVLATRSCQIKSHNQ